VANCGSVGKVPPNREVVEVVPHSYILDGQDNIKDPFGMTGTRLEIRANVVSALAPHLHNVEKAAEMAKVDADALVPSVLASARAVLNQAERDAGVCVVDIGATSTDLCVYHDGAFRWLRSLPIGGMHLTNDLAVGLKTNLTEAQRLKHNYGAVVSEFYEEEIEIAGLADLEPRRIHRRMLSTILQPRLDEIFTLVKNELAAHGVDESLPSGVVITGGASTLKGLLPSAEKIFRLPVRIGRPEGLGGLSDMVSTPQCSTIVGLAILGCEMSDELKFYSGLFEQRGISRVQKRLSRWFKDFF
jgi:cell division protein FtsA